MHRLAIVIKGSVFTGKTSRPLYEAVVVEDNMIRYVGWLDEALRVAGNNAKVLDFDKRLVTPGFIDSHCHMAVAGLYMEIGVSLQEAESIADIIEIIRRASAAKRSGEWIYAYGLDESRLKEKRLPTRWELDNAAPHNPVVVEHISGHLAVANSEALKRAGITKETRGPSGGVIERDVEGEPTGVLYDSAMMLVYKNLPQVKSEHWVRGLHKAQKAWLSRGFTAVEDTGTFGSWKEIVGAYKALLREGELRVRARVAYALQSLKELDYALNIVDDESRRVDNEWLRFRLIKFFYDGSGLARTALLYDDWCKNYEPIRGYKGVRVTEFNDAKTILKKVIDRGLRVAVHAIGDRAVDEVLKAYSEAVGRPLEECELSIVHALLVSSKSFELLRKVKACIKTQPGFIYTHGHVYAGNFCEERARHAFPLKSMLRAGVVVASSTDAPFVSTPNPAEGVYGAVYRRPRIGRPNVFGKDEALSFVEALETYTHYSAKATGWDDIVGVLESGKRADIVVWNIEGATPSEQDILSMRPILVMVNGRIMYKAPGHVIG